MKKQTIVFYLVLYILFKGIYYFILNRYADSPLSVAEKELIPVLMFLLLLWISTGLWKNTTDAFLKKMGSPSMIGLMITSSIMVWFVSGVQVYHEFYQTDLFENNKFLFTLMAFSLIASTDILVRIVYIRLLLWMMKKEIIQ